MTGPGAAHPVRDRWAGLAAGVGALLDVEPITAPGPAGAREAGRRAAARVLRRLGSATEAVGRASDGRPLWPAGVAGSISHRGGLAVVVAARTRPGGGHGSGAVGVDVEQAGALPADDAAVVLSAAERRLVAAAGGSDLVATTLWSAKEAAFKAWSGALDGLPDVDPTEIEVVLHPTLLVRATGSLASRVAPVGDLWGGTATTGGLVVTVVAARAAGPAGDRLSRPR